MIGFCLVVNEKIVTLLSKDCFLPAWVGITYRLSIWANTSAKAILDSQNIQIASTSTKQK